MVRIVHTADLHLCSGFDGLPQEQSLERRREFRENLLLIAQYARDNRADLLLIAGDLFDGADISYETAEAVIEAFTTFEGPIVLTLGNHDFMVRRNLSDRFIMPDNVYFFHGRDIRKIFLPQCNTTLYGASFDGPYCEQSMLRGFRAAEDDSIKLMVLHGDAPSASSLYNPLSAKDIEQSGLDYLALGHVHKYSGLKKAGATHYAYPGCPQGRGFDETGEKGFITGVIEKGKATVQFVPIKRRQYLDLQLDAADLDFARIAEKIKGLAAEQAVHDSICRIRLIGERADEQLQLPLLQSAVEDCFYSITLQDFSFARRNIWEGIHNNTLEGLFLQRMRALYDAAKDEEERRRIILAVRFALSAMEGREQPL